MSSKYALEPSVRAVLIDMGLRPANVLRRAGLRADLLAGGPVWLQQDEFFSLWEAIEVESADPNLPLLIEQAFTPEAFAPTIFAAMMSPDLNTAARRIATYKKLIGPLRLAVDVAEAHTTIRYEWPTDATPPASLILAELLFWVEMARTGTRHRVQPVEVTAPTPPVDAAAYRAYLGVDVTASTTQSVRFTADDAARPFVTANTAMWETFEPALRRRLADLDANASTTERVEAVLLELLPVGRTTVADIATELAMSPRTLHRRLQSEASSYQQILDSTRERLARHYLSDPSISAAEISFLLGYEETSSFYRAFHNWTGETPEGVRSSRVTR